MGMINDFPTMFWRVESRDLNLKYSSMPLVKNETEKKGENWNEKRETLRKKHNPKIHLLSKVSN